MYRHLSTRFRDISHICYKLLKFFFSLYLKKGIKMFNHKNGRVLNCPLHIYICILYKIASITYSVIRKINKRLMKNVILAIKKCSRGKNCTRCPFVKSSVILKNAQNSPCKKFAIFDNYYFGAFFVTGFLKLTRLYSRGFIVYSGGPFDTLLRNR